MESKYFYFFLAFYASANVLLIQGNFSKFGTSICIALIFLGDLISRKANAGLVKKSATILTFILVLFLNVYLVFII